MDGYQRFLADPVQAWRDRLDPKLPWARALGETLAAAKPNAGHRALAELERVGCCGALITQNIDDLHRQAGTRNLLEIHGNHFLLRCTQCVRRFTRDELPIDAEKLPPRCPDCDGVVKGDTVQFGEPIPPDVLRRCYDEVARADCMIVAGTSATVYPAAEFPAELRRRGGAIVEVNLDQTELTSSATHPLRGPGGGVLERLLHHVLALGKAGQA
jgi:NAD-dependent deacetylase